MVEILYKIQPNISSILQSLVVYSEDMPVIHW